MKLMHVAMHDIKKTWQFANMCNSVGSQMQSCEWSITLQCNIIHGENKFEMDKIVPVLCLVAMQH